MRLEIVLLGELVLGISPCNHWRDRREMHCLQAFELAAREPESLFQTLSFGDSHARVQDP